MLRWPHLIAVGFLLFTAVTAFIATLGMNIQVLRSLSYIAISGYGLGILGMAIAVSRAGIIGRVVIGLIFALGTASIAVLLLIPRWTIAVQLPF